METNKEKLLADSLCDIYEYMRERLKDKDITREELLMISKIQKFVDILNTIYQKHI